MRRINPLYFALLFLAFFAISCTATTVPSQKAEATLVTLETLAETQTPTSTLTPAIPVMELPNKHSDAARWKNKLKGIAGEFYSYDSRDISPNGHWFVFLKNSSLRLISLDNLSQISEYQIESGDIREMWVYSWSPDSSAFLVCVNYTHNPNGCQAIKIFEISQDDTLKEHNVAWDSGGYFQVLWAEYGKPIGLISPYSGVFMYNRKGSLLNHAHLNDIIYSQWVKEGRSDLILVIERSNDPTTLDFLPSKIYELDAQTLEPSEIYRAAVPLSFLGSDLDAKYFLFEEISPDGQQSISLDLFELETRTIIQRYVFPPNTKIGMRSSGQNQIAFEVKTKDDYEKKIWVFDFKTRIIEFRGMGVLLGWLHPNEGFLVRDDTDNWTLLPP